MQYKHKIKAYGRRGKPMIDAGRFTTLVGKEIKINRGGPEVKCGKLLSIKPDHLALYCEGEGVIYFQTEHIKSITINGNQESSEGAQQNIEEQDPISYVDSTDFPQMLQHLTNSWVQINRGGPEKLEGILVEANNDYLKVSANDGLMIIMTYHVKSVSLANKNTQSNSKNQEKSNESSSAQNTGANNQNQKQNASNKNKESSKESSKEKNKEQGKAKNKEKSKEKKEKSNKK